ncbi:hypothetical protein EYY88_20625 [Hafnia alvei]|nr:hypothetical protein EYY88_20625 [Hafnia alvei]
MDMESCLPLLYPLRYHIDHLAHRSLSTQSASLQTGLQQQSCHRRNAGCDISAIAFNRINQRGTSGAHPMLVLTA